MSKRETPLLITLRVQNRNVLGEVVEQCSELDSDVEMISIVDPFQEDPDPIYIDVSHITQKQWVALEVAHRMGHYSSQRGGSLEDIARDLGISKSAASQRLRAAEAKIISSMFGAEKRRESKVHGK